LAHFHSLKEENDNLQSLIATRSERSASKARSTYPLHGDDLIPNVELGEESSEEEVAERREVSAELVWVQNQVRLSLENLGDRDWVGHFKPMLIDI